jgi:hypothetical protein
MGSYCSGVIAFAIASVASSASSDLGQEFPTPLLPRHVPNTGLFLRIRGDWTTGRRLKVPCVAALPTGTVATLDHFAPASASKTLTKVTDKFHKHITLGEQQVVEHSQEVIPAPAQALANGSHANSTTPCAAHVLWDESDLTQYLQVEILRPSWSFTEQPQPGTIWYVEDGEAPIAIGEMLYYPVPTVKFLGSVVHIGVRTFLNPGWRESIHLSCTNCTEFNRLVVREV